jgi:hypothetical protein
VLVIVFKIMNTVFRGKTMNFKMNAKDFELLAKFVEKKAKGADLTFRGDNDAKLEVRLTMASGEDVTITFTSTGIAKIIRARNLGDEL